MAGPSIEHDPAGPPTAGSMGLEIVIANEQFDQRDAGDEAADMGPKSDAADIVAGGYQTTHELDEKPVA